MSTKIDVRYIDTGEHKIFIWDGELLEAANEYDRRVKEWGEVATKMIEEFMPYNCYYCHKPNAWTKFCCYDCEAEGERDADWKNGEN